MNNFAPKLPPKEVWRRSREKAPSYVDVVSFGLYSFLIHWKYDTSCFQVYRIYLDEELNKFFIVTDISWYNDTDVEYNLDILKDKDWVPNIPTKYIYLEGWVEWEGDINFKSNKFYFSHPSTMQDLFDLIKHIYKCGYYMKSMAGFRNKYELIEDMIEKERTW